MSNQNEILAGKVQMFINLLFQIDDYIRNKKERKDQLRLSKNFRLVFREVISSKILLNILINNEDLVENDIIKKSFAETKKEKAYIKSINPLSFNQKNMNNINLFYNSNTEIYVINYLVIDKIFSLLRYCLREIIKRKNTELGNMLGDDKKTFVLNNSIFDEFAFDAETNEDNIIRKMLKKKYVIENLIQKKNKFKLPRAKIGIGKSEKFKSYDASKLISDNYNINNLSNNFRKSLTKNDEQENYIKEQVRKINIKNRALIPNQSMKSVRTLNYNMSLPLIYNRKILNHKMSNYYEREKNKIIGNIKLFKSRNKKGNVKYTQNKFSDNKENPLFKNSVINQYHNRSQK